MVVKRAQFIDKSVEVRNMFKWAAPAEVLVALKHIAQTFMAPCCGTWVVRRHLRCTVPGTLL